MKTRGRAYKYGDNVDTDVIIPARYLNTAEAGELARHCLEDLDATFAGRVRPGDIVVAGRNFGCGSSREHAPLALKASGVSCVVAASFARIFYRNALNIGLAIFESEEAAAGVADGDTLSVDFGSGEIFDETSGAAYRAQALAPFMQELVAAGGLAAYTRARAAGVSGAAGASGASGEAVE